MARPADGEPGIDSDLGRVLTALRVERWVIRLKTVMQAAGQSMLLTGLVTEWQPIPSKCEVLTTGISE